MANEVAGIDVLLYINTGADLLNPTWVIVGGQRGLTVTKSTEIADARHKSSGAWPNNVPTFLQWQISCEVVKITGDPTQAKIDQVWRARGEIHVRVLYEDGSEESGMGLVGDFTENDPHDGVATRSLRIDPQGELFGWAS
jgi:predicted secreted protein